MLNPTDKTLVKNIATEIQKHADELAILHDRKVEEIIGDRYTTPDTQKLSTIILKLGQAQMLLEEMGK